MRYARGKSTHQRVEGEATSWKDLKSTPVKNRNSSQHNKSKGFSNDRKRKFGAGKKGNQRFNRRDEEESSNFTPLGERPKKTEDGETEETNTTKGFGKSKLVKIFGQFWVPPEDAKRLQSLHKKLQAQGLSRKEILEALQNERRRAEKAGKRRRDKTCFNCRQFGHVLSDCPTKMETQDSGENNLIGKAGDVGEICFKCGSTEHTSRRCKRAGDKFSFANCFICSKSGHIARQCPENSKGIYPVGGCCGECGEVTHLRKDCPTTNGGEGGLGDTSAIAPRLANPFTSTEYEPEDSIVQPSPITNQPKKKSLLKPTAEEPENSIPLLSKAIQKAKRRKVKF